MLTMKIKVVSREVKKLGDGAITDKAIRRSLEGLVFEQRSE